METVELFYLESCPYCRSARRALEELCREDPGFAAVPIRWIEESREPEIAEQRDYYYVPTLFCRGKKLYEAAPGESYGEIREHLRTALNAVRARE